MAGKLQPLDQQFAIVGEDGRPTLYFIKWAQQRQIDISGSITLSDLADYLNAHRLVAGTGIQITPDGNLANSPSIQADVQEILDELSATRGVIIFRGLLGWSVLLPGTAGLFLQTAGAGADPLWAAPGGGGGGSTPTIRGTNFSVANSASFTVPLPTGTIAGDLVIMLTQTGWAPNDPAGWTILDATASGGSTISKTYGKVMTAGDIAAGSVTMTFNAAYWAGVYLITITGTTMSGIRDIKAVAGLTLNSSIVFPTDRMLVAVLNRQVNTPVSVANSTALITYNVAGEDHSAFVGYYTGGVGPLGTTWTASPTGHYFIMLALR